MCRRSHGNQLGADIGQCDLALGCALQGIQHQGSFNPDLGEHTEHHSWAQDDINFLRLSCGMCTGFDNTLSKVHEHEGENARLECDVLAHEHEQDCRQPG